MARIRVVTDSACDLTTELAEQHGVTIVPLSIRFGSEEYVDGSTLSTDDFWARCKSSPVLPETAAPSPGAFQEAFLEAARQGYDGVLCLTLSGGVSATLQAATAASKSVSDTIAVRAVDSRSLTLGLGLMVIDIAERAAAGAGLDELEARVAALVPRASVYGAVDTLEHLEKGGRIGGRARSSAPSSRSSRWSRSSTAWSRRSPNSARGCAPSSTWPTRHATPHR